MVQTNIVFCWFSILPAVRLQTQHFGHHPPNQYASFDQVLLRLVFSGKSYEGFFPGKSMSTQLLALSDCVALVLPWGRHGPAGAEVDGSPLWRSYLPFWTDFIVCLFRQIMYFLGFRSSQPSDCKNNSLGITPPTKAHLLTKYRCGQPSRARAMKVSFPQNRFCATYFPKTVTKAFVQLTRWSPKRW